MPNSSIGERIEATLRRISEFNRREAHTPSRSTQDVTDELNASYDAWREHNSLRSNRATTTRLHDTYVDMARSRGSRRVTPQPARRRGIPPLFRNSYGSFDEQSTLKRVTLAYKDILQEFFPSLKETPALRKRKNNTIAKVVELINLKDKKRKEKYESNTNSRSEESRERYSHSHYENMWIE